ncbi:transcription initiation factor TFIIH subunit 1 [Fistulifera solaris]|uniref:Transcription initiation factor TFIIH subunit 1 n=1 Tax=Fistulifera solaris TaxID=1519565 RepID=A0A1Z5JBH0_FISSO|nr:transcription initiation factor TFIIH subunit 1 [Fistulifera solaris]|eukprot:GAX11306.1 transcription initiation factor TFIIH subunit 1 [Fistulifera solaris]
MQVDEKRYSQVIFQKQSGELVLNETGLQFGTWQISWTQLVKHQVSPASYPKALLKLVLQGETIATFQFINRTDLERIRKEISFHLQQRSKKRPHSELATVTYGAPLDSTATAVTRASLLAAHPSLRQQHAYLVQETRTLTEDEFWETHQHLLQEEHARISGLAQAGRSSFMQSRLPTSGRITLGVEEMRQIFILYPAVHKAYEEKVPLELSDEQFWRKYLESEYFHRDRGRLGTVARNHANGEETNKTTKNGKKPSGPSMEEQDARAAAVGTDDFFSRYAQKLQQEQKPLDHNKVGRRLATGQFDLASTLETERGHLLQGPKDNHPGNVHDDEKGARVIAKYNRHWAMVLHPDDAVAGADLLNVARQSPLQVLPDDEDAKWGGGVHKEMQRLVGFAEATEEEANHADCRKADDAYEPLSLKNVEAYYSFKQPANNTTTETSEEANERYKVFANTILGNVNALVQELVADETKLSELPPTCFPPPKLGRELLSALTKKMAADARTDSASLAMVEQLPSEFREKLQIYFRRCSELLRHFFALRQMKNSGEKLARIVLGMETFYRELDTMRKGFPHTDAGNMMQKMCLPLMDQLDWAFKLHREGSGGGGGGGFVTVEEIY